SDESIYQFKEKIASAKTVVWNGPLGLFEEGYDKGSKAIASAIIESPAYEVVGGGETVEFLAKNNLLSKFSFVSSGGGAMLEFLAGRKLPALEALQ
ncbi:phosphoglycerate kinase, partial [Candidatus Curtissbacteria bacterium RIFCSPHIGHO2_12_41_11]